MRSDDETSLEVPTSFSDVGQLAQGLSDRVKDGMLMLYGPTPVDEMTWVRFAVRLADESPALQGLGRAIRSVDGGTERPDLARFDIVLDSLQLEGTSQVVFETILMQSGEPHPQEHDAEEADLLDAIDVVDEAEPQAEARTQVSAAAVQSPPGYAPGELEALGAEVATGEVVWRQGVPIEPPNLSGAPRADPVAESAAIPAPPVSESKLPARQDVLTRPSLRQTWHPAALAPEPEILLETEQLVFPDAETLAVPAQPPSPDLDPALRVTRAPFVDDEGHLVGELSIPRSSDLGSAAMAPAAPPIPGGAADDGGMDVAVDEIIDLDGGEIDVDGI